MLFTEARANPVLTARRAIAQDALRQMVLTEREQTHPGETRWQQMWPPRCTPGR